MGRAKAKKPHPGKGAAFRVYQSSGHQNGLKTGRNDTSRGGKGTNMALLTPCWPARLVARALLF